MSVAAFIRSQRTEHDIDHITSCRALGVSQSWFYKWKNRIGQEACTAREQRRADLAAEITRFFKGSGGTYGSPRITRDLHEEGWRVSENTVAAQMTELGLIVPKRRKLRSLTRQGKRPAAPDLVRRKFTAPAPDVLWCGDVTQIDTDEGKLYLLVTWNQIWRRVVLSRVILAR
ncbi:IS3 family transposase [Streptosporangium amethystogenes]|uniref:IS3 family transposase n=1 Tax=Streptosporangium amethystogenes TaxID=2002 RepID=UPI0037B355F2